MCRINNDDKGIENELKDKFTQYQREIDKICGQGEWIVLEYTDRTKPVILQHRCGHIKKLTRAKTFTAGGKTTCKQCKINTSTGKKVKRGRPKLSFEDLDSEIKELTHNEYELVELNSSIDMLVNHKKCDLPPFRTNSDRFLRRNHRCPCKKDKK